MSDLDWAKTEVQDETIQGSQAWLAWRNKGLGSSDAAVLLGWSPWKTIQQLYEEKLGLWKPVFGEAQRRAMDRGKELEPKIRAWYEEQIGAKFPDATKEHPIHKFMRASYDGLNESNNHCLEIKAPNAKDHALARLGFIPEKYRPQCQWLLKVGNLSFCHYVSYGSDDTYGVVVTGEDKEMQAELLQRAITFWDCVQNKIQLPDWPKYEPSIQMKSFDLSGREITPTPEEQDIEALVAETLAAQSAHKAAEAKFEALKERLKKLTDTNMSVGEALFGWNERKGNIQYKDIPELKGLDLEPYRGKTIQVFYFKRKGEK